MEEQGAVVAKQLRETRVETVQRIAEKEVKSDEIIAELTKTSVTAIADVKEHAMDLENSIKYRVSDCETLVKSRITEDYVKNLGERIKQGMLETVSSCLVSIVTPSFIVRPQERGND